MRRRSGDARSADERILAVLRELLSGAAVTAHGGFFDLDDAVIAPAPTPSIPIIVGGRSDAAVRRAGEFGDGWLGIWNSPRRFVEVVAAIAAEAERVGRADPPMSRRSSRRTSPPGAPSST